MRNSSKDIKTGSSLGVVIEPGNIGSGASFSGSEINHFFLNNGGEEFLVQTGISGADHSGDARSFALFDYNHDGYQDFILVGANRPYTQVFRNRMGDLMPEEKRLQPVMFQFVGGNRSNQPSTEWGARDGFGAKVSLTAGDMNILREYRCGEGLGAQNSATMSIGIGGSEYASNARVVWPSGRVTEIGKVSPGEIVVVYENAADSPNGDGFEVGRLTPVGGKIASDSTRHSEVKSLGSSPMLARFAEGKTEAKYRMFTSWFTTCSACKTAAPLVSGISENFEDSQLAVFGFNNDSGDSVTEMKKYASVYNPSYIMLTERSEDDIKEFKRLQDAILGKLKIDGAMEDASALTPGTIITDADGNILYIDAGVPTYSAVQTMIRKWEGHHDF
ncbi:MAG: ASPIC/UnbV domain-containing protein [Planctomycetota bacterium]|nr:ASPIC/UnbV domain-containing protein [Planctomycetota bacterium]MDA1114587.1 ASPIC/UnbV domain-containing protein [Planctomycetota bacterium]